MPTSILRSAAGGLVLACAVVSTGLAPGAASAQDLPNVFFDCDGRRCNRQYFRTEITWVNWVNDKEVADVHIIMTSQGAGSGGREYILDFIGTDPFEPYSDSHSYRSFSTDTEVETLDGITQVMSLGMALFANHEGYRDLVDVVGPDPDESNKQFIVSQDDVNDPWNLWVFSVNGQFEVGGESTYSNTRLNSTLSAGRTTPDSRVSFWGTVRHNRVSIELTDSTFVDTRTDWDINNTLIYPIAAHWSLGVQSQVGRMVRVNQDFRAEMTGAVEYSVFPYEEATRRAFTFYYRVGPAYRRYLERTRYDEMEETRWEQTLQIRFSARQPWGNADFSATGSHFLHDFDRNLLRLDSSFEFRIVRGLSFSVGGNVAWVDDQIYLSAGGVTDEEALLRLQQRASSFDYEFESGFRIQFGSIYNNAVNNRIGRRW